MSHVSRPWAASSALLLSLTSLVSVLGATGCDDDKKISATAPPDSAAAEASRKPALGGKLAAAVKAAESAQAPPAKGGDDGPPEKGIFAPGAADKVIAAGAPAKLDVLGDGAEPRVLLGYAPSEGEQKGAVSVALRQQGRGAPVEYALSLKVDKAKADKDKKADASAGVNVTATVSSVSLPPGAPKEATDQFGKLKGSEIRYALAPQGAMTGVTYVLAKGAEAGLDQALHQIVDGMSTVAPLLPPKPVGVGAYWMITDRPSGFLVEVIRYRVFRLEKVEKDRATFSVDIRQYAAKTEIDAGDGQKLALDGFDSSGKGKTEWTAAGLLPARAESSVRAGAQVHVQGQQAALQMEMMVKVTGPSGDKDEKKK
jgi:hypothetical protein